MDHYSLGAPFLISGAMMLAALVMLSSFRRVLVVTTPV
jgi:hypothetical protein